MKKTIVFAFTFILIIGFNLSVYAGWQLYDDFNSDSIDTQKWSTDDSSAAISLENGQAKFVHQAGHPNDSSYLIMIKNPETIKGIKAKITVKSCSGDVRARMASFIGKTMDDYIYTTHQIRSDRQYISAGLSVLGPAPDYVYKKDFFYGHFKYPSEIINIPYTLSMIFSLDNFRCAVDGLGETEYTFPNKLSPTDDFFKAIGTRSSSGEGTCTVYFDDVYVYRQSTLPATNLLLLQE